MGHHAEHVTTLADDPSDVALGAVGVGVRADFPTSVRIPEDNAPLRLELLENAGGRHVPAVAVRDGNSEDLAKLVEVGEHGIIVLDTDPRIRGNELQVRIAHQRSGEQSGFARDLKSVADAKNRSATFRVARDFLHDWAEARYGSGAEIVAVAESTGQYHDIRA